MFIPSLRHCFSCSQHLLAHASEPPSQPWFPKAPPLPSPTGQVIRVTNVQQLFQAARDVQPRGTILIADGHYMMPRYFELSTDERDAAQ